MAHATTLPSNCWGYRVDQVQPTRSPLLNNVQAKTDSRVSPRLSMGAKWKGQTDDEDDDGVIPCQFIISELLQIWHACTD